MEKSQRTKLIYSVFIAVFAVAIGLAIICVAADIYYSGKGTDVIYSREIVADRLGKLAIPLLFFIASVIVGFIFPLYEVKAKAKSEDAVKKLVSHIPNGGDSEEYLAAEKEYKKYKIIRLSVWCGALAVALAGAIYTLCYLTNTAHFQGEEITSEILGLVKSVLVWALVALVLLAVASTVNGIIAKKQVKVIGLMIKHGKRSDENAVDDEPKSDGKRDFLDKVKKIWNSKITLWVVRGVIFVIGVTFIIVGALNGGAHDVLLKAVNICTECIGLG